MKRGRKKKVLDKPIQDLVRVIQDCRDARRDYFVPRAQAKALYESGKLAWDVANGAYTEKSPPLGKHGS